MKNHRLTQLASMAFAFSSLAVAGSAKEDKPAGTSTAAVAAAPAPSAAAPVAATSPEVAFGRWSDIKDCTFDTRVQFFAGLARLEARVDREISELTAKRAAMTAATSTKEWDFAMKEMSDARAYLKDMGEELRKATAETWDQAKDKVGQAWTRTQEAFGKVKSSTTT